MDSFVKKVIMGWAISLSIATVIMLVLLLTGESSLNFTLIIFLFTVKFLGGFGIILAITSAGIFLLQKFPDMFSGEENKKRMKVFMVVMIIIPVLLMVYYGPYKIYMSYTQGGIQDNILDKLLFVYGIVNLMISLYVIPLIQEDFVSVTKVTTGDMIKKTLTKGARGFKKKFFSWRKSFAKAQLQEHLSLKEYLDLWRQRLAVVALIMLGIGSLIFTPIAVIFIVAWLRVYFFTRREPFKFEIYLIVAGALAVAVISALIPFVLEMTPFYAAVQTNYYWLDVSYFIGMTIASLLYISRLTRNILSGWKLRRKTEKVEDLKKERDELKRQLKETKKNNNTPKKPAKNEPEAPVKKKRKESNNGEASASKKGKKKNENAPAPEKGKKTRKSKAE